MLKVFKLRDPATDLPFPAPIPRSAFPAYPDYGRKNIFIAWQTKAIAELTQKRAKEADAPSPSKSKKKPSKLSKLWGGKHDKTEEEPEAMQKAAHEKKVAAMVSVGASAFSALINEVL